MPNGLEPKPINQPTSKPRWKSKTYWWGGSLMVLALAIFSLPEFQALIAELPPQYAGWATGLIAIVTLILRELTKEPVG